MILKEVKLLAWNFCFHFFLFHSFIYLYILVNFIKQNKVAGEMGRFIFIRCKHKSPRNSPFATKLIFKLLFCFPCNLFTNSLGWFALFSYQCCLAVPAEDNENKAWQSRYFIRYVYKNVQKSAILLINQQNIRINDNVTPFKIET